MKLRAMVVARPGIEIDKDRTRFNSVDELWVHPNNLIAHWIKCRTPNRRVAASDGFLNPCC